MSCTVLLELNVKPELVEATIAKMGELLPETRKYEGCIDVYAYQDQDNPTTIVAIEQWQTRQAYEKYFAWRTETGVMAKLGESLEAEPSLRFFDKKA